MQNSLAIDWGDCRVEFFVKTYINAAGIEGYIPCQGRLWKKGFSYVKTKQESVQPVQSYHKIIFNAKDYKLIWIEH
jgi:hypothetical protein